MAGNLGFSVSAPWPDREHRATKFVVRGSREVEKAVKERKAHRNAADFDGKFIREVLDKAEVASV